MYGNGAKIGMAIIAPQPKPIPKVLQAAPIVWCAAAAGSTRLLFAVLPTATTTSLHAASTTSAFGWFFPSKQLGVLSLSKEPLLLSGYFCLKGRGTKPKKAKVLIPALRGEFFFKIYANHDKHQNIHITTGYTYSQSYFRPNHQNNATSTSYFTTRKQSSKNGVYRNR